MYSDKKNATLLTALLVAHGVRHVVVCPGSRNAALVHNFVTCSDLDCHAVTDERSAAFYALGLTQATGTPAAVCVTSGSALLNTLPAVAEASLQREGIIVISADRPAAWIGQLDGQTLPQPGALGEFVGKSVQVEEPRSAEDLWHATRLINEALLCVKQRARQSVHINVPLSRPLFEYNTPELPHVVATRRIEAPCPTSEALRDMLDDFKKARRPMVIVGQTRLSDAALRHLEELAPAVPVYMEPLSGWTNGLLNDALVAFAMQQHGAKEMAPDFVIYVGATVVGKHIKQLVRQSSDVSVWMTDEEGSLRDPLQHTVGVVEARADDVIRLLPVPQSITFAQQWTALSQQWEALRETGELVFSQAEAVRLFEEAISQHATETQPAVHYANSNAVRLGCLLAKHKIWVNRGVNGIEGSVSTAAGFSLASGQRTYLVTGDLSFFYDGNALWNSELNGDFRVLLLNNHCGGIMRSLDGMDRSAALNDYISASHGATAEGLCRTYNAQWLHAEGDNKPLREGIRQLVEMASDRPVVLEVTTDDRRDRQALKQLCGL